MDESCFPATLEEDPADSRCGIKAIKHEIRTESIRNAVDFAVQEVAASPPPPAPAAVILS
eukprot:2219780-Rhodomonas_salina.1